jgi:hypothetical protein
MDNLLDTYTLDLECNCNGERFSVRDNGAVLKHPRIDKNPRPTDNQWTFGKPNKRTGYMEIASVRIHRIVATAFHGIPPTEQHVVDHIDTNRKNNRPENLRWVTKLENVLLNPITAKRIALVCGSVEAFLSDPSKYRDRFPKPNIQWMFTVSSQEAQASLERMYAWANSDKHPSGGSLDDWIFNRDTFQDKQVATIPEVPDKILAKTPNAAQLNWRTPSEFPCCPQEDSDEPIAAYAKNLKTGSVFCRNELYSSLVSKSAITKDCQSLYIISESPENENAIKPWALAVITYEDGLFMHTSLHNFFTQEGAEKQYCLAQGLEWSGGDSIDDYC